MTGGPVMQIGKILVFAGFFFIALGILLMAGARFSFFGFGRLPGDIVYKGKHGAFYFPIVSCLILSAARTLAWWVVSLLTRK